MRTITVVVLTLVASWGQKKQTYLFFIRLPLTSPHSNSFRQLLKGQLQPRYQLSRVGETGECKEKR